MKNYINLKGKSLYAIKFDLKMKLAIYLFLVSLLQVQAKSYSQRTKISLNMNGVSLENVLLEIEKKNRV